MASLLRFCSVSRHLATVVGNTSVSVRLPRGLQLMQGALWPAVQIVGDGVREVPVAGLRDKSLEPRKNPARKKYHMSLRNASARRGGWSHADTDEESGSGEKAAEQRAIRKQAQSIKANYKVGKAITSPSLRVIGEDGKQVGIMSREAALSLAQSRSLDLVQFSDQQDPPVARLMKFGDWVKARATNKVAQEAEQQAAVEVDEKEMRLSSRILDHDLKIKARRVKEFLEDGKPVKVNVSLAGETARFSVIEPKRREVMLRFMHEIKTHGVLLPESISADRVSISGRIVTLTSSKQPVEVQIAACEKVLEKQWKDPLLEAALAAHAEEQARQAAKAAAQAAHQAQLAAEREVQRRLEREAGLAPQTPGQQPQPQPQLQQQQQKQQQSQPQQGRGYQGQGQGQGHHGRPRSQSVGGNAGGPPRNQAGGSGPRGPPRPQSGHGGAGGAAQGGRPYVPRRTDGAAPSGGAATGAASPAPTPRPGGYVPPAYQRGGAPPSGAAGGGNRDRPSRGTGGGFGGSSGSSR